MPRSRPASALWGPAHGGANEAVLEMLEEIGTPSTTSRSSSTRPRTRSNFRLMGFGHRVYKNFDPRAKIIREMCHKVLAPWAAPTTRCSSWRMRLEEIALKDEYFVERKLYPNVDFYSGIIYSALNIPRSMFTVMFAIARTAGWVAHWQEEQVQADGGMLIGGSFQHGTHQSRFKLVEETHRFLRSGTQAGQDGRLGLRLEQALVFAQGRFDFSVARQISIWRKPQPRGRLEFRRVIVTHALVGNQARGFNRNASSGVAMSAPRRMVHQNTS
jgi:hypothetical protein